MTLVDLETSAAEGRLRIAMDLFEQYGTSMGWDDQRRPPGRTSSGNGQR